LRPAGEPERMASMKGQIIISIIVVIPALWWMGSAFHRAAKNRRRDG
jgi:hypothetical protein